MSARLHVAVAGAGIVGAAIAHALAVRGARVTLFDAAPASGASAASFGWINASFAETDAYFALRRAAVAEWNEAEHLRGPCGPRWGGSLWWEEEGEALAAQAATLRRRGHEAEVVGRETFARLAPAVADPPEAAILASTEGSVDAAAVARHLALLAAGAGATVLCGPRATGLILKGGRVSGFMTGHGEIEADESVVALGASTGDLLAGAGLRLPMDNRAGLILHTLPVRHMLDHLILSPDIHFRQDRDGRIVAGEIFSGDGPGSSGVSTAPWRLAAELLGRLDARLPGAGGLRAAQVLLGLRPVPADGLPAVGRPRHVTGLTVAVMHSGVTLGPLVGRLVAEEILSGSVSPLLAAFRPERFA
ncbi:MAG: FAD-binding oxidoreductase [Rhodobacteraceae bacterium]|nr:FAD-binding oxidoreductase [Paracoccaceae bacterium]